MTIISITPSINLPKKDVLDKYLAKFPSIQSIIIEKKINKIEIEMSPTTIAKKDKIPKNKLNKLTVFGENLTKIKKGVA